MIALLNALKGDKQENTAPPLIEEIPVNSADTLSSAQTMAAVESQLRHLQLQHAEAQNRMQELTQYASDMAEKINNESQEHNQIQFSIPDPSTPTDSLQLNSEHSDMLSNHEIENTQSFNFLVPTISDRSESTLSANSSPNVSIVPSGYSAGPENSNVTSARTQKSTVTNKSDPTPRLLQSNLNPNVDSDIDTNLNNIMDKITAKFTMPKALSPFRPLPRESNSIDISSMSENSPQYQQVMSRIANSQVCLSFT